MTSVRTHGQIESAIPSRCGNAQPGTFGHECGAHPVWIGSKPSEYMANGIYHAAFCDSCRKHGHEARLFSDWRPWSPRGAVNVWK